ncbi:diaminopimelate epimerase [Bacillus oleivorans]|nr:diaminopimelate epimerase [Bacillus oleivorans]
MRIPFTKMNGCGNDFILVDNREGIMDAVELPVFVKNICRRKLSLGADGVILLEPSAYADFRMRYFNADGSEGEMCGNGARCAVRFAHLLGIGHTHKSFETADGLYEAEISESQVRMKFPDIGLSKIKLNKQMVLDQQEVFYHFGWVGVPHTVILLDHVREVESARIHRWGQSIRWNLNLFPQGTNVNFVQVLASDSLILRTYERGVEEETMACGTGAVTSAIICGLLQKVTSPVRVQTNGGTLKIEYRLAENLIQDIFLEGPTSWIADGYIESEAWRF